MRYHEIKDPIRIYNEILGGKWRLLILFQLFRKTQRFKDLGQSIEGITPRMLTKELRILEKYNLVEKEVYREVPPRVEYSLTDEGVKLYPLIESIIRFGEEFAYLLEHSEEDLVQISKERNAMLRSMEERSIEIVSEDNPMESIENETPHPETIEMLEENELSTMTERKSKLKSDKAENEESVKKPKSAKKKNIKISENTNAVQLELF